MFRDFLERRRARREKGIAPQVAPKIALPQVALPSKVIQQSFFPGQNLSKWIIEVLERYRPPDAPPLPPPPIVKIPAIIKGILHGAEAGRWYRYAFPRPLKNAVVTANPSTRVADWKERLIERIPGIAKVGIVRVMRADFNSSTYCNLVASGARDRCKQIGPPWPLDIIWDWFCDTLVYSLFYAGWLAAGWILNVLWDSFIQPQIDRVKDSIDGVVNNVASGLKTQIDHVTEAMNHRLGDLYTMWGLPYTLNLSTVMLRNVNSTGFEWLSLGNMDIWFQAIGDPE